MNDLILRKNTFNVYILVSKNPFLDTQSNHNPLHHYQKILLTATFEFVMFATFEFSGFYPITNYPITAINYMTLGEA